MLDEANETNPADGIVIVDGSAPAEPQDATVEAEKGKIHSPLLPVANCAVVLVPVVTR